jgi:DNA-binding response OmpR family regulator
MTIVLLSGDLLAVSRVAGAAAQQGIAFQSAPAAEQAAELCRTHAASMLIVDLSTPSLDVDALVGAMKTDKGNRPTIVAFGPHVHEERLAAARDAGCDRVVSRGQFMAQVDTLLQL